MNRYSLCKEWDESSNGDSYEYSYMELDPEGEYVLASEALELQPVCEAALEHLKKQKWTKEELKLYEQLQQAITKEST